MSVRFFRNMLMATISQVKENLPDGEIFHWKRHLLPDLLPFLKWKERLQRPGVLRDDFSAGLLGAIVVLPQAVAFALIAGLPPVYGLYSAMIPPIIAALFGSSRHLVSGPTTAVSLIIAATIGNMASIGSPEYIQLTLVLTFLMGAIQLGMGIGKLGRYIGFVSHTVIMGFTAGAAALIITSQMENVLGIQLPPRASFLETWGQILWHIRDTRWPVLAVAFATIFSAITLKKLAPSLPNMIFGLAVGTGTAFALGGTGAGIEFVGQMPSGLPPLSLPPLTPDNIHLLLSNAFAVAVLGLVQAVAIGQTIAAKTGQQINGNQEFIGQGLSNIFGSFFSSYASSGSFSRSALNYESGAHTPMSTIFSSVILMVIVLFIAPYAQYLPMPAMAGLVVLTGWNLFDLRQMEAIQMASREDNIILGTVFFATLFSELQFAIYLGVLLSLYFYLRKTATPNVAIMSTDPATARHEIVNVDRRNLPLCPQVLIVRIDGNLFFGAVQHVATRFRQLRKGHQQWIILLANGINHVDLDGAEWLAEEARYWKERKGGGIILVRLKIIAQDVMQEGGFMDNIGADHFFTSKTDAIAWVYSRLDRNKCLQCPHRVFKECESDPELAQDTSIS